MQDPARASWVDLVGESVVAGMAEAAGLQLTEPVRELLDAFAPMVERESRTRALRTAKLTRALGDVRATNTQVAKEVEALRHTQVRLKDTQSFRLDRHPETTLPVVTLRLRDLPDLVIAVPRDYGAAGAPRRDGRCPARRKLTFGFATRSLHEAYKPMPMPAKIAAALATMAASARERAWAFSVEELVLLWMQTAKKIPVEERRKASKTVRKFMKDRADGEPARKRRKCRPAQQLWRPGDRTAGTEKAAEPAPAPAPPTEPDSGAGPVAPAAEAAAGAGAEAEPKAGETTDIGGAATETPAAELAQRSKLEPSGEVGKNTSHGGGDTNEQAPRDDGAGRPFQPGRVYDVYDVDV